jgi:hypothetical protein
MSETCRSCKALIMWLDHVTTGKAAPIDADPSPDGNIRVGVAFEHYTVLTGQERKDALERGDELHLNHYATCPQAKAWRERAAKAVRG